IHSSVEQVKKPESQISTRDCFISDDYLHWPTYRPIMSIVQETFGEIRRIDFVLFLFVSLPLDPAERRKDNGDCNQRDSRVPEHSPNGVPGWHIYSDSARLTPVPTRYLW